MNIHYVVHKNGVQKYSMKLHKGNVAQCIPWRNRWKYRYSSTHSQLQHWMEVTGQQLYP